MGTLNHLFDQLFFFGLININVISQKFKLSISQINDLIKFQKDISILDNKWIYDADKSRNRLYNILQKIFNVNAKINKFEIIKAIRCIGINCFKDIIG